jgi:hypothetical protein
VNTVVASLFLALNPSVFDRHNYVHCKACVNVARVDSTGRRLPAR